MRKNSVGKGIVGKNVPSSDPDDDGPGSGSQQESEPLVPNRENPDAFAAARQVRQSTFPSSSPSTRPMLPIWLRFNKPNKLGSTTAGRKAAAESQDRSRRKTAVMPSSAEDLHNVPVNPSGEQQESRPWDQYPSDQASIHSPIITKPISLPDSQVGSRTDSVLAEQESSWWRRRKPFYSYIFGIDPKSGIKHPFMNRSTLHVVVTPAGLVAFVGAVTTAFLASGFLLIFAATWTYLETLPLSAPTSRTIFDARYRERYPQDVPVPVEKITGPGMRGLLVWLMLIAIMEMIIMISGRVVFARGDLKMFVFAHVVPVYYLLVIWLIMISTWIFPNASLYHRPAVNTNVYRYGKVSSANLALNAIHIVYGCCGWEKTNDYWQIGENGSYAGIVIPSYPPPEEIAASEQWLKFAFNAARGKELLSKAGEIYEEFKARNSSLPHVPTSCCDIHMYACMQDYYGAVVAYTGVSRLLQESGVGSLRVTTLQGGVNISKEDTIFRRCQTQSPYLDEFFMHNSHVMSVDRSNWDHCVPYKDTCSVAINFGHFTFFFLLRIQGALHLVALFCLVCVGTSQSIMAHRLATYTSRLRSKDLLLRETISQNRRRQGVVPLKMTRSKLGSQTHKSMQGSRKSDVTSLRKQSTLPSTGTSN